MSASSQTPAQESVRPEVGKPLQAAQELMRSGKHREALARLREAEAVGNRTPYEGYLIERLRGSAAAGVGDDAAALAAFDAVLASGRLQGAEKLSILEAMAGTAFRKKDYKRALGYIEQHAAEGGSSASLERLRLNAFYLSGNYAGVVSVLKKEVQAAEQPAPQVDETLLRMLAASQAQLKDDEGYLDTLVKLLRHHPKREYWADALSRLGRLPGMLERHGLDYLRLGYAVQNFERAEEYVELAQQLLHAGVPAEAQRVVEAGYAARLLGTGADADRHKRLRDLAQRQAVEDRAQIKTDVVGRPSEAALATGMALVSMGRNAEGIPLLEQALARPGLRRPDEARLRLGQAYLAAGQASKAVETFGSIAGSGPVAALARFWQLHALARRAES
jgi:thioredoxin-like negative regulator of GroEL